MAAGLPFVVNRGMAVAAVARAALIGPRIYPLIILVIFRRQTPKQQFQRIVRDALTGNEIAFLAGGDASAFCIWGDQAKTSFPVREYQITSPLEAHPRIGHRKLSVCHETCYGIPDSFFIKRCARRRGHTLEKHHAGWHTNQRADENHLPKWVESPH